MFLANLKHLQIHKLLHPLILLAVAAFSLAVCQSWTAPFLSQTDLLSNFSFLNFLPGDLPQYFWRFFIYFVFLGLLPFITLFVLKFSPFQNGLSFPTSVLPWYSWLCLALAGIGLGFVSSFFPDLASYYPYSKTLIQFIKAEGFFWLLLHCFSYLFFYYLPWEFFFRGFLIFPFLKLIKTDSPPNQFYPIVITLFQTIPSMMLHPGHPFSELLAAIPAGFLFGYLAYKTKSIWPGLVLHASLGLSLDLFIILKSF